MKINISFFKIFIIVSIFGLNSCETLDLNQLEDPSGVSNSLLDPIFAFNYVQLELPGFVNSANTFTQRVTRQMAMTGGNTYDNAFTPNDFNGNWTTGYNILSAIKRMEPKAIENEEFYALGAAKVIRCYILLTMTDMYGDIPVKDALLGNQNLAPQFDKGADVYKQILLELDDAIATLSTPNNSSSKINDLYYSSQENWITLAKTLKLKMFLTAKQAGSEIGVPDIKVAMETIINAGDYIDTPSEDFVFQYGNSRVNPNTRHPLYNDQYELGGGAYIANYMMWVMSTEKDFVANPSPSLASTATITKIDPRINYYFYKQESNPAELDLFELPNRTRPSHYDDSKYNSFFDSTIYTPYSLSNWYTGTNPSANGYLGRDHGNNSGIPPDANLRTVAGVYPIGGAFGTAKSVQTSGVAGAKGAGIMPILLSSFVHFMKAEAILTLGLSGDAKAEFLAGVSDSMNKSTKGIGTYPILDPTQISTLASNKTYYLDYIGDKYDDLTQIKKLELVIKEYFIAAWGNGIEPYNNYRRTGYPSNFQPTLEPVSGEFFYRAYYPLVSVNNNLNTPSNSRTKRVFWDKANLDLH